MRTMTQADGEWPERGDRASCPECNGTGSVRVLIGPDEALAPCESCAGMGYQLTRDEFANIDAIREDRELLRRVS